MQISENIVKGKCLSKTSCHKLSKQLKLWPFWFQSVHQLQVCAIAATAICFTILCMNEFMCWTLCVSWTKHSFTGVDSWTATTVEEKMAIAGVDTCFCETGSVQDKKKSGWQSVLTEEKLEDVWVWLQYLHDRYCTMCYSSTQMAVRKLHLSPYFIRGVQELKGPDSVLHIVSICPWGKWNKHVQFGVKGLRWYQSLAKFGKCFFFVGSLTAINTMHHWKVEWFMNDECESIWKKANMACTKCY